MQAHIQDTPAQQELARAQLGWEPWSGTLYPGQGSKAAAKGPALAGITFGLQAQLGGVGLSLVAQNEELLYGRISGIQVRAVTGIARQTLELAVQHVQVVLQSIWRQLWQTLSLFNVIPGALSKATTFG